MLPTLLQFLTLSYVSYLLSCLFQDLMQPGLLIGTINISMFTGNAITKILNILILIFIFELYGKINGSTCILSVPGQIYLTNNGANDNDRRLIFLFIYWDCIFCILNYDVYFNSFSFYIILYSTIWKMLLKDLSRTETETILYFQECGIYYTKNTWVFKFTQK